MQETLNIGKETVAIIQPIRMPQTPSWRAADVARYFGVKVNTVYKWVYDGKLTAHKTPGGRLRFVESEVKAAQLKKEAE